MRNKSLKLLAFATVIILLFGLSGCKAKETPQQTTEPTAAPTDAPEEVYEEVFASWSDEAPALDTLIEYVEAVTDESSPEFIPVDRRIAVFDMDGTI